MWVTDRLSDCCLASLILLSKTMASLGVGSAPRPANRKSLGSGSQNRAACTRDDILEISLSLLGCISAGQKSGDLTLERAFEGMREDRGWGIGNYRPQKIGGLAPPSLEDLVFWATDLEYPPPLE